MDKGDAFQVMISGQPSGGSLLGALTRGCYMLWAFP